MWIRAITNIAPFSAELDKLLTRNRVVGHEFIYGELFIGDLGGRSKTLMMYRYLKHVPVIGHDEVLALANARKLNGRGLSWIDVHLLASAFTSGTRLWTADTRFATAASELGIAFERKHN